MSDDIYIRYLESHYKKHGTINNIDTKMVVEFEGEKLHIGRFLKNIRFRHKKYIESPAKENANTLSLQRYEALDKMGFEWQKGHYKSKESAIEEPAILYLRKHYLEHKTINDIDRNQTVIFNGQELKIGRYLTKLRELHSEYLRGIKNNKCSSPLALMRYSILEELEISWNVKIGQKRKTKTEDIRIRYLREHFAKNGTINDIKTTTIVEYEGQTINIGNFITMVKKQYHKYQDGINYMGSFSEVAIERYQIFEELGIIWELKARRIQQKDENDPYIEYLKEHFQIHGTINNITVHDIVEYHGMKLNIGNFISKIRTSHTKYLSASPELKKATSITLRRFEELDKMGFIWSKGNDINYTKIAQEHGVSRSSLTKAIKQFGGDVDKALKICLSRKKTQERKKTTKKDNYSIKNILDEFNIDIETLIKYLEKEKPELRREKGIIKHDLSESLRSFCIRNGYNYNIILRAIKMRKENAPDESLESLIEKSKHEYLKEGQSSPITWVYTKYDDEILVKHLFLSLGFDYHSILRDMLENDINLDIAFENESFRRNKKDKSYLEGIYHDLINFYRIINASTEYTEETASNALIEYVEDMIKEYHLSKEEFDVLNTSFNHYTSAVSMYRLFDVAFEENIERKIDKIIFYGLDEDDIEESFFIPLKFEQKVLIGRESELYRRRIILKNLTISWNLLTEEEQKQKIVTYSLTEKERTYITSTRSKIDQTKQKVYSKK